jgi:hypothetical protein
MSGPSMPSMTTGHSRPGGVGRGISVSQGSADTPMIRRVTRAGGVDLLGRSLPAEPGGDPADIIRRYLAAPRTDSAKALAAKAVVLIHPENRAGEIVWPVSHMS